MNRDRVIYEALCRCPHDRYVADVFARATVLFDRRTFLKGAVAAGAIAAFWPRELLAATDVIVLRAARLFDGTAMRSPGVLVVRGDKIVSLNAGDAGHASRVWDLGDATLMPGLIDMHTHVSARVVTSVYLEAFFPPNEASDSVAEAAILSTKNAAALLHNGFTTVRDVGSGSGIDVALRDAINREVIVGPRMLVAGQSLSITGGHGDYNDLPADVHVDRPTGVSYGPYGFREKVRENVKRHVDVIKVLATGGILSYGDTWNVPQMNLDEIRAVVDESTKFGLRVSAHCHGDPGISLAVRGGVHSIDHCTGVSDRTLNEMKQRGTYWIPTVWALDSILQPGNPNHVPENSVAKARLVAAIRDEGHQRAIASGAKVAYGTDAGVFPHRENNKDFARLSKMGMHHLDLLRSCTAWAADLLGRSDRGRLETGKLADIVAVPGNPSANIRALESPKFIMLGGKVVSAPSPA